MGITSYEEKLADRLAALESRFEALIIQDKPGSKLFTAGRIPFAGPSGVLTDSADLRFDSAARKIILNGGNITGHTVRAIDATFTETDASATIVGYMPEMIFNPGATQITGGKFNTLIISRVDGSGGASAAGASVGLRVDNRYDQTAGTFSGIIYGVDNVVRHDGEGTLVNAYASRSVGVLSSTGNLTSLINFLAESPSRTGSGTITTAYGLRINRQKLAAGVTTGYGVYQVDSNDTNYYAGNSRIGDTGTPAADLEIVGAGTSRTYFRIDDTSAASDTYILLDNSGNNIASGSFYILAKKGSTTQFSVRGDGVVNALLNYQIAGTTVVSARQTGWALATGTATRTTFATSTVTLPQLAERVKALIDDLHATAGHGLIGT